MPNKYERVQIVLGGLVAVVWGLSTLSRRLPHVGWLRVFRDAFPRPSEEQRAKMMRRSTFYVGVELILLGIVLPMGYVFITAMLFNSFTTRAITLVAAGSVLCIGLGITAIWQSLRG